MRETLPVTPQRPPPATFKHRLRVRYAECDAMGVAHHAGYAIWLEEARTEMLRESGVSYADLERSGVFLVVTRLETRFKRPIRYDDVVEIRVEAEPVGRARLRHAYEISLVERAGGAPHAASDPSVPHDGVCARAETELACVEATGRPTPMPAWLLGRERGPDVTRGGAHG